MFHGVGNGVYVPAKSWRKRHAPLTRHESKLLMDILVCESWTNFGSFSKVVFAKCATAR